VKSQFQENYPVLPIDTFPSLVLPSHETMLQHLIIQFLLDYLLSGRLREIKENFKLLAQRWSWSLTRGCRLQEVSNIVIWLDGNFWYFGKLIAEERWSLTRGFSSIRYNTL